MNLYNTVIFITHKNQLLPTKHINVQAKEKKILKKKKVRNILKIKANVMMCYM